MAEKKVLGIVGSPRKDGRTNKLVTRAIEGSKEAGAETEIIYLIDYDIPQWSEEHTTAPEELIQIMDNADAYVLGAPVYVLDINGLTKDFIDALVLTDFLTKANGKPALGIAVAGGGGGATLAVRTIYWFFLAFSLRGINPLPVSRFNYDRALREAYESGKHLVELEKKPFKKKKLFYEYEEEEERVLSLAERNEYYFRLPFMNYDLVDEILWLAEQVMEVSKEKGINIDKAKMEYEKAKELIRQGRKDESIEHAARAYATLYY